MNNTLKISLGANLLVLGLGLTPAWALDQAPVQPERSAIEVNTSERSAVQANASTAQRIQAAGAGEGAGNGLGAGSGSRTTGAGEGAGNGLGAGAGAGAAQRFQAAGAGQMNISAADQAQANGIMSRLVAQGVPADKASLVVNAALNQGIRGDELRQVAAEFESRIKSNMPADAAARETMVNIEARGQAEAGAQAGVVLASDQVQGQVRDQVQGEVRDQVRDQIRDQVQGQVREQVQQDLRPSASDFAAGGAGAGAGAGGGFQAEAGGAGAGGGFGAGQ